MAEMFKLALSIPEVMEATGLGKTTICSEIAAGKLKIKKVGRRTIIEPEEARRYIRELPGPTPKNSR